MRNWLASQGTRRALRRQLLLKVNSQNDKGPEEICQAWKSQLVWQTVPVTSEELVTIHRFGELKKKSTKGMTSPLNAARSPEWDCTLGKDARKRRSFVPALQLPAESEITFK